MAGVQKRGLSVRAKRGLSVCSFGTGSSVCLPGPSQVPPLPRMGGCRLSLSEEGGCLHRKRVASSLRLLARAHCYNELVAPSVVGSC